MQMLRKLFMAIVFCSVTVLAASGCVPLWVGAGVAGIVGGYAVSPDTVEGMVEASLDDTYDAVKEILSIMGHITQEGPAASYVTATINGVRVTITLMAINISSTKLSVKARKSFMPKMDVAQDVYTKIINQLSR